MEIRELRMITEISIKIFYVWFFPADPPINRRESDANWQWLRDSNNHYQVKLHSLLFIGESIGKNVR